MEVKNLEFSQYCCLNRSLMRIDEESDARWFFGNKAVETRLIERISSDFNTRGVPKCAVLGRWGIGKTHSLNHLKWVFENEPSIYRAKPLVMQLAPWDDANPRGNNWGYVHRKIMDAIGEHTLRELVTRFDQLPGTRTQNLAKVMEGIFKFGDANLKYSLAVVLADSFLREQRSTVSAWEWLRGGKVAVDDLGANRVIESVQDMVDVERNIAILARKATSAGFVLLIDEAHALGEVKKKRNDVHYGFKELADQNNSDLGFVLALFGGGMNAIPSLLTDPKDILDRMGVTSQSLHEAFIELKDVTASDTDITQFALNVLHNLKDHHKATEIITEHHLATSPDLLPFTKDGIGELVNKLKQKEETKAPRLIIENLATIANKAYQEAKSQNKYVLVDSAFVNRVLA